MRFAQAAGAAALVLGFAVVGHGQDPDADGDGLPDVWEQRWGLDAASADGADGAGGDPDGDGLANAAELAAGSHPRGHHTRRLAEGAANAFFAWQLALANPHTSDARVLVTALFDDGSVRRLPVLVAAQSRLTVQADDLDQVTDAFSVEVESDLEIGVDRTMTWNHGVGSHAETGVVAAARRWLFAEGATGGPFNLFYLLQNPGAAAATVTVRFLRPAPDEPIVRTYTVPPRSRHTIWVDAIEALSSSNVSADLSSTEPLVVERAMYLDDAGVPFRAGHVAAGVTTAATSWFLAEGATGGFFDLYLLVANPDSRDAAVTVSYLLPNGTTIDLPYTVAAGSRLTIRVDDEAPALAATAVSMRVVSTNGVPVVVERTMWWPDGGWVEAHTSLAATATGVRWLLAEGETGGPDAASTYVLVANLAPTPAMVRATLLFEGGPPLVRTYVVPGTSRFNLDVAAMFPESNGRRFATLVESIGATPAPVVAERSVYTSPGGRLWEAGTNAAGIPLMSPLLAQPDLELFVGQAATELDVVAAGPLTGLSLTASSSAPATAGVSLDPQTGRLTVTPGTAGAATITLTATRAGEPTVTHVFTVGVGRLGAVVSFGASITLGSSLFPAAADLDGDGIDELFGTARDSQGGLALRDLRAMGLGPVVDLFPQRNRDNRIADFTGDGRLDMVTHVYTSLDDLEAKARLFVGQADGTFVESPAFTALDIRGHGETIVAADFDDDGDLDIFLPQYTHDDPREHFWLLLNDGQGGFTDVADTAGVATRGWPVHLRVEGAQALDFNGDGRLDLFAASHFYLNTGVVDGIPRFIDRRAALGLPLFFDEGLRFFDADNDGELDLVLQDQAGGPTLFRSHGGLFTRVPLPAATFSGSYGVNACDLNGDGWEDLVTSPGVLGTNHVYLNTGAGFVLNPATALDGVPGDTMVCADFNADGRLDLGRRVRPADNLLAYALNTTPHDTFGRLTLDVVDAAGRHNQQGRVVRIRPRAAPHLVYTRIVDGGAGLLGQGAYTLLVGTPYAGEFDVTIVFAGGTRQFVVRAGQRTRLFADGRSVVY